MNYIMVLHIIGWIVEFEGGFLLLPGFVGLLYGEYSASITYFLTAIICCLIGFLMRRKKPQNFDLYAREGFAAVALSWIAMSVLGAIPFVAVGDIPNYVDALFETISGFTTTGASILPEVEHLTHAGLFWRSFTHWIGGMGVFVFIMSILPLMGGSTINLMRAESPGPSVSKLVPRVRDTAKILYQIYIGVTLLEILLLCICRMPLFDAFTITFGTVGTGGFGVRNDSIAGYSPAIQIVITVFMVMSGMNYVFYFALLRGKFKDAFSIEEVRWYLFIVLASVAMITWNIRPLYGSFGETTRHAFFQVGSILTTTGYSTVDFDMWPQLSKTVLLTIMFIGGCAGSTSGGIKVSRLVILAKAAKKEVATLMHPRLVKRIQMDGHNLSHETIRSTNVFISVYCLVMVASVLLIALDEFDFTTNFTAVVATLNNIGPGLAGVGPAHNFGFFSNFSKIVLMFDMLAGRLELFPMLIVLSPSCWKRY